MREHLTGHTCDVRLKVSELQEFLQEEREDSVFNWDEFKGVENDPYEKVTENDEDVQARAKTALNKIFSEESAQGERSGLLLQCLSGSFPSVVSITSHSGFIQGLSIVLGRQNWVLPTGGRSNRLSGVPNLLELIIKIHRCSSVPHKGCRDHRLDMYLWTLQ